MSLSGLLRALQLLGAPCRAISGLISESMDRPLARPERVAVQLHTLYCGACHRFARQARLIHVLLAAWAVGLSAGEMDTSVGPSLPAEVRESIQKAIRENA